MQQKSKNEPVIIELNIRLNTTNCTIRLTKIIYFVLMLLVIAWRLVSQLKLT